MNHSRGALMAPILRKRKEREDFFMHPSPPTHTNNISRGKIVQPYPLHHNTTSSKQKPSEPVLSNQLLAGYLAHEFLTQGTLLGQKFDPARAESVPLSTPADLKKKPGPIRINGGGSSAAQQQKTYGEVSRLVKTEGAHIPGIVNPTQLARWIQM